MEKQEKKNIHSGHRESVRARFLAEGLSSFEDHQVLELILFYAIPRRDTNPTAHLLVEKFGSLSGVFNASVNDLMKVKGVGLTAATLIKTYAETAKRYYYSNTVKVGQIPTYDELGEKFVIKFKGVPNEEIYAVFFDNAMRICGECKISCGSVNSVSFSSRDLAYNAINYGAVYAVLAHNHPHGTTIASSEDLSTTTELRHFLAQMHVDLLDHFIVAESSFSSITKERYIDSYEYFIDREKKVKR